MENKHEKNNQPQNTQEKLIIEKLDEIEAIRQSKQLINNESTLTKIELNKKLRKRAFYIALALVIVLSAYIFFLTQLGLSSRSYNYVQSLGSWASPVLILLPLISGVYVAYRMSHPTATYSDGPKIYWRGVLNILWIIFIVIGLTLYVIPGIILLIVFLLTQNRNKTELIVPESVTNQNDDSVVPIEIKSFNIFLVIIGFFIGAIPGFIYAILIVYPLSSHACRLSGAKYC